MYTIKAPDSRTKKGVKIFKCKVLDPSPRIPEGFTVPGYGPVEADTYVKVSASSVQPIGKDYTYSKKILDSYVPILTEEWETFMDPIRVSDLKEGDDFLVYYGQIDQTDRTVKVPISVRTRGNSALGLQGKLKGKDKTDSVTKGGKQTRPTKNTGKTKRCRKS